jgi:hypothetical protein
MNSPGNPNGPSHPTMMPMPFPYPMMMPMFMAPTGGMAPGMMPGMMGYNPYQGYGANMGQNGANGPVPSPPEQPYVYKSKRPAAVSKEECLERFNVEVLPKLGYKRLMKLQAVARGLP